MVKLKKCDILKKGGSLWRVEKINAKADSKSLLPRKTEKTKRRYQVKADNGTPSKVLGQLSSSKKNRAEGKFKEKSNFMSRKNLSTVEDISEEDISSSDDLSLNDEDLPIPPDTTTTDEESLEEDDDVNNRPKVHTKSKLSKEEQRTVFVGNLPNSVSKSKLTKWFLKFGNVESVRLRCSPLSDPDKPKRLSVIKKSFQETRTNIHGFVRFASVEEASKALVANGELFDDSHHLRVDLACRKGCNKNFDNKKAVFIGNLPFTAEEDQLRDIFADCGDIENIRIIRDKQTSVGKGFAYINFTTRNSASMALEKNGIEFCKRKLRVQHSDYNQKMDGSKLAKKNFSQDIQKKNKNVSTKNSRSRNLNPPIQKPNKECDSAISSKYSFQGKTAERKINQKKISKKKKWKKKEREVLKKVLNKERKQKS